MQSIFGFAVCACVMCVHVNAIGAAVDLRNSEFHKFDQTVFQFRSVQALFQVQGPLNPSLIGKNLYFAYCLEGNPAWNFASNSIAVELVQ